GAKILLPLDLLALEGYYLPATAEYRSVLPHDYALSDQVLNYEFSRRFASAEFRAGRVPLWSPDCFAGAPFAHFGKYSPFSLVYYCFPSPVTLAWLQLLKSLVAGVGAYLFFRRVLHVGYWPAAFGAWAYPLTGFFVLWQGYPLTFVTAWFPYVLLATDSAVRRPRGWGGPALAVLTCLTVLSGHADVAGLVLLASAAYAVWCLFDAHGRRLTRGHAAGACAVGCGWALGLLLATPYLLPLLEYVREGDRMIRRQAGATERPGQGLTALPQAVLPEVYGSTRRGSAYVLPEGNQLESAAATYTGLLATLLLAPLAWCSPRHRSVNLLWVTLGLFAFAWALDVPGVATLLGAPLLNLLSYNRFVFVTSFALLALAVVGLDVLRQGGPGRRWWFALPAAVLLLLGGWCVYRSSHLPEPVATEIEAALARGERLPGVRGLEDVQQIRETFTRYYAAGAVLCGLGLASWLLVCLPPRLRPGLGAALGALAVGELLWSAYGVNPQSDPSLYYPPVPALVRLAEMPPGRILGVGCLPPNLNQSHGLRDIRGYDGIDPRRLVALLNINRDPSFPCPEYARTQWYVPLVERTAEGRTKLPPVLNMLNVRYLIFRAPPPTTARPLLHQDDYWVVENPDALPRAYVPRRVEVVPNERYMLRRLAEKDFDPRRVAYVDRPVRLPEDCRGSAEVVEEVPGRVTVSADMETAGLLVLSDLWFTGWRAYRDGEPVPVLRANHALRGVALRAGRSTVVFRYEPASFTRGVQLLCAA
ncbi:MAG TPA: hypothetical protein VFE78_21435, partial [Gemmataceae bacterium]|nr:hypothetical protein [Gemmataceae bacterium]